MKKALLPMLLVFMSLMFFGCGGSSSSSDNDGGAPNIRAFVQTEEGLLYLADGESDPVVPEPYAQARSIAAAADGTVYAAGEYYNDVSGNNAFLLKRDGSDTTDLDLPAEIANLVYSRIYSVAVSDGTLYAAGRYYDGSNEKAFLLKRDGSSTELISLPAEIANAAESFAYSVAAAADGTVYAAGEYYDGSSYKAFLVKYDGSNTTHIDLHAEITGAAESNAPSVAVAADGTVYAAGEYYDGNSTKAFLVKYDGSSTELISLPAEIANAASSFAYSVAVSDGTVYAAGEYYDGNGPKAFLVKYDGSSTELIGLPAGIANAAGSFAYSVATAADGTLYAAGRYHDGSSYKPFLLKYNGSNITHIDLPDTNGTGIAYVTVAAEGTIYISIIFGA